MVMTATGVFWVYKLVKVQCLTEFLVLWQHVSEVVDLFIVYRCFSKPRTVNILLTTYQHNAYLINHC